MNIVLFDPAETQQPLARTDRRALHILEVLRRGLRDAFDVGLINGPRGKATITKLEDTAITLAFTWDPITAPEEPVTLLVGMPRPQTARDILREATTLGVSAIHFVRTEKGDPNYVESTLWRTGEWRRFLIAGAEQAFHTRIPRVTYGQTLSAAVAALEAGGSRLGLDNYEAPAALGAAENLRAPIALAVGGERGWSAKERSALRAAGFQLVHLGSRVLRTETACIAALSLTRAKLGLM